MTKSSKSWLLQAYIFRVVTTSFWERHCEIRISSAVFWTGG